jgi:hypothetical protein
LNLIFTSQRTKLTGKTSPENLPPNAGQQVQQRGPIDPNSAKYQTQPPDQLWKADFFISVANPWRPEFWQESLRKAAGSYGLNYDQTCFP